MIDSCIACKRLIACALNEEVPGGGGGGGYSRNMVNGGARL